MFKHSCFPLRKNNFPISQTKVEHPAAQHITGEAFGLFYFLGQSTEEWIKNLPVFNVLPFLEEKEIFVILSCINVYLRIMDCDASFHRLPRLGAPLKDLLEMRIVSTPSHSWRRL